MVTDIPRCREKDPPIAGCEGLVVAGVFAAAVVAGLNYLLLYVTRGL